MKGTTSPRLETAIRAVLAPVLREDGFSGSGRTFRRMRGTWIQVLNVQRSRYGGSFAINLGVQPLAIPDVLGNTPDPKKITESLCEFRRRLSEAGADQWWQHGTTEESMRSAMEEATATYRRTGNELLQRACDSQAGFNAVLPTDFSIGAYDSAGFGSTQVRMALALARLRKVEGKLEEARAFASLGLAQVGSATLLRRELEALTTQQ
ncbi:DUF4304 domain-containing protein [Nitrogeniibacter aestuarii]|uniref:DUF4304 domain-containing protein n=1 Tax=Nitrogeniibacter aestuarii TaxID=2815343 RepID=UPI001D12E76C|nr:DUF4304 domain-containing protein [Nitrogeniibacter aestuarii]